MRNLKLYLILSLFWVSYSTFAQDTKIGGFANIDLAVGDGNDAFYVGQYASYVSSQITDRISLFSEVVFEFDDGWILDVERVIIKYEVSHALNIKVGRIHTPIGYWNNTYHHGALLQPTIARPLLVKFEDEGGILPIHNTGLWISGSNIGGIGFGYDLVIANGLGNGSVSGDENENKSITAGIHIEPLNFLEIGISTYVDNLPSGSETLQGNILTETLSTNMYVAHLAYLSPGFESIAEYYTITNNTKTAGDANTTAFFVYAGYNIEKFTPYIRYDKLSYDNNESYFTKDDKTMMTLGLRYSFSYLANLKLEYSTLDSELAGTANQFTLSWAIGF